MSFFETLAKETAAERAALFAVPQIVDGLSGRISLDTYRAYLAEAYHHVRYTVPLMALARSRMDSDHAAFAADLDEYIEEETGHEAWILNDIRAAGGDAERVRNSPAAPATQRMIDYALDAVGHGNSMSFFGMVFVLEGVSVQIATQGAQALGAALGLGPECFSYLRSHGSLDLSHMAFFERLMARVDRPEDQQAIIAMAKAIFVLFADLFRAIPHNRETIDA